jgi:hypothetical protein
VTVHREQNMKKEDQQDATIRCLLLTSVSTCFGHHYAHLQQIKGSVTAFGVLFWFCTSAHILQDSAPQPLPTTSSRTRTTHHMQ